MRSAPSRRSFSPLRSLSFLVVALVVGTLATVGTLVAMGIVNIPFLNKVIPVQPTKLEPSGVPVVLSGRPIPAYTKVTREYLFDPKSGEPRVRYVSPEEVKKIGMLTDLRQILGRVICKDKSPGYAFTEKDFFPDGTRPGLVAGVPPGKRAFVLEVEKIAGIANLREGDHFDLLGATAFKGNAHVSTQQINMGMNDLKVARVKPLVEDGVVVVPMTTRDILVGNNAQTKETSPRYRSVQEVTVAIDPKEAAPVSEALAIEAEIICVARSGQPEDRKYPTVTPGLEPKPAVRTVETIIGNKHQVLYFPVPDQGPQELTPVEPPAPPPPFPGTPPPGSNPRSAQTTPASDGSASSFAVVSP